MRNLSFCGTCTVFTRDAGTGMNEVIEFAKEGNASELQRILTSQWTVNHPQGIPKEQARLVTRSAVYAPQGWGTRF